MNIEIPDEFFKKEFESALKSLVGSINLEKLLSNTLAKNLSLYVDVPARVQVIQMGSENIPFFQVDDGKSYEPELIEYPKVRLIRKFLDKKDFSYSVGKSHNDVRGIESLVYILPETVNPVYVLDCFDSLLNFKIIPFDSYGLRRMTLLPKGSQVGELTGKYELFLEGVNELDRRISSKGLQIVSSIQLEGSYKRSRGNKVIIPNRNSYNIK